MNRTQELIKMVEAGSHRITEYGYVQRWVASRGEWMTSHAFRKDVIDRAFMHFYRATKQGEAA